MAKLMKFWTNQKRGSGIKLTEAEGKKRGLTPVTGPEIKSVKPVETKELKPEETKDLEAEEEKAVSTPLPTSPAELDASSKGGVVSKPKAVGKK